MQGTFRQNPFLAEIEARFAFLRSVYGFELEQSTDLPPCAWFRTVDRLVVVGYDPAGDTAVSVRLEAPKATFDLWDIAALETDVAPLAGGAERALVIAEIGRAAELLQQIGDEFLSGLLHAFQRRHRETLFVNRIRAIARDEYWNGDPRRSIALFEALREHWTETDRLSYERLKSGDGRVAHLRSAGRAVN
jgi:hypothetical protein